jgi:indolepyruvate ferredoxin oxidoreductase beta subunit
MNQTTSVVLCGVGGQGILLASEIIAQAAMNAGFDVKTNEVHGMAQRGGSVIAQIRYGSKVYSPLVAQGTAHVLCSLEQSEALRYADYLMPGGLCVVNAQQITPVTVSMGASKYPENVEQKLRDQFPKLVFMDASKKAIELGNIRTANVVLLGALSNGLNLPLDAWHQGINACVKEQYRTLNLRAFESGRAVNN